MQGEYRQRLVDSQLDELLPHLPGIIIQGPRACGKTTTALRRANSVNQLDQPAQLAKVKTDPQTVLSTATPPVLVDEWQRYPECLSVIKGLIDTEGIPGRFLVTGSVGARAGKDLRAATGRLTQLGMWTMNQREINRNLSVLSVLDYLKEPTHNLAEHSKVHTLIDYVDLAFTGGFPQSVELSGTVAQQSWLTSYVSQLLTREDEIDVDVQRLDRFARAYASVSGQTVTNETLRRLAGDINTATATRYESILEGLFISHALPAWWTSETKQLTKTPKRFLTDTALLGPLGQITRESVLNDGRMLGSLIETFVVQQLRVEADASRKNARLFHVRTERGRQEIDVVVEFGDSTLIGIEVKANVAPDTKDAKHLVWLRENYPDRFIRGIVFHTGPHLYNIDSDIVAAPISSLWA